MPCFLIIFHFIGFPINARIKPLQTLIATKIPIVRDENKTVGTIFNFLSFERATIPAIKNPDVKITNFEVSVKNL